jgi:glyoxylase-like metal-dependent hydrolase (beta-lactamase superfamily II)
MRMREYRHNPCLMRPLSTLMLILFCLFSLLVALFHIPGVVLGFLLSPILKRTAWLIEFLYPMGIARWAHFFLVKASMKTKKLSHEKGHSRTTEQRIEVVKGRVYIHPIPQLLDNIAYLVVCCPPPSSSSNNGSTGTLVAFLVDCGDASAALYQVNAIRDLHYADSAAIEIQTVLCTHKHHDHTAGNKDLLEIDSSQSIVGGSVERVPYCNVFVKNGDILDLPSVPGNNMNEVVRVEVIAVPAHTRGSVVFALRPTKTTSTTQPASFLFTGDTMFSGGSGVPFESDIEFKDDKHASNKKANSPIRASTGNKAVERCFMEILYRGLPHGMETDKKHATTRMLVFPGHEYTADIIGRQFTFQDSETSRLNRQTPSVYFETASQLYVSFHRRRVVQGKLLCIPSPMSREIAINPHMRTLTKRGEHVIRAVRLWHQHFAKSQARAEVVEESEARRRWFGSGASVSSNGSRNSTATRPEIKDDKTPANAKHWNISAQDVNRPVFATVYADDLQALMEDLTAGRIKGKKAAKRLERMQAKLQEPVVGRRPIPDTLPTEKNMYLAILGFVMLGSPPCAMTLSDSRIMKLPAPTRGNDDDPILISKRRLLSVLECLGYLSSVDGSEDVRPMIHLLWEEAHEYGYADHSSKGTTGDDVEAGGRRCH